MLTFDPPFTTVHRALDRARQHDEIERAALDLDALDAEEADDESERARLAARLDLDPDALEPRYVAWNRVESLARSATVHRERVDAWREARAEALQACRAFEATFGQSASDERVASWVDRARSARDLAAKIEFSATKLEQEKARQGARRGRAPARIEVELEECLAELGIAHDADPLAAFDALVTASRAREDDREHRIPSLQRQRLDDARRAAHAARREAIESELASLGAAVDDVPPLGETDYDQAIAGLDAAAAARRDEERRLRAETQGFLRDYEARAPALREEIETLERARHAAVEFEAAITLARDTLATLGQQTHRVWASALQRTATDFLRRMGSDVTEIHFDEDLGVQLRQQDRVITGLEAPRVLSAGALDAVFPGRALSRWRGFLGGEEDPLPLVLDDPLANADDRRLLDTLRLLIEAVAPEQQVLLMACQHSRYEWAAEALEGDGRVASSSNSRTMARRRTEFARRATSPHRRPVRVLTRPLFPPKGLGRPARRRRTHHRRSTRRRRRAEHPRTAPAARGRHARMARSSVATRRPPRVCSNAPASLRKEIDTLVVVGHRRQATWGARAVLEATAWNREGGPRVFFAGHHLEAHELTRLLASLEGREVAVNVISKSGTTTEPAIAFRLLRKHLEDAYGPEKAARRIVATTDGQRGALRTLSEQKGYTTFVVPDDVGGRFSVLSPVGLLPLAVAGCDVTALLDGAAAEAKRCLHDDPSTVPAVRYAALRHAAHLQGSAVEVLASFFPSLHMIAEWWKQLYGESEGKQGRGLFPAAVDYTTDLHSMGQYLQDGRRILLETFLDVEDVPSGPTIPSDSDDLDGLEYLAGRHVAAVNREALPAVADAHVSGGVPCQVITLPDAGEASLGSLLYFFEFRRRGEWASVGRESLRPAGRRGLQDQPFSTPGEAGFHELSPI